MKQREVEEQKVSGKRRNKAGEETRAAIRQSAFSVLLDVGLPGLTMQEVAARAGIRYGNLTHHYSTKGALIEAVLDALEQEYVERFMSFALTLQDRSNAIESLLTWLLDDAVTPETSGMFLELWSSATRDSDIARRVHRLYDQAIEACIASLDVDGTRPQSAPLRSAFYLLGTIVEGSSALFASRDREAGAYAEFRRDVLRVMVPLLEQRLADARCGTSSGTICAGR